MDTGPEALNQFTNKLLLDDDGNLAKVLKGSLKRLRILVDIASEGQTKMQREGLELCDETLLNVCEMGDLGSLAHLLSKDHDETAFSKCNEAFVVAAEKGHKDLVLLLLDSRPIDPTVENQKAIREASKNGHRRVVKLLLKHPKVDPSYFSNYAIRFAAENGHDEVVGLLLGDKRVDPSAQMDNALIEASKNGHVKVVELLLEDERVNPLAQRYSALTEAIKYGRSEVIKILLSRKPISVLNEQQIQSFGPDIARALDTAKKTGHVELVDELITSGIIPETLLTIANNVQKQPAKISIPFAHTSSDSDSEKSSSSSEGEGVKINIHCIQHIEEDGLGAIQKWIEEREYPLTISKLWEGENFPSIELDSFDWLIILGGVMGANDEDKYSWMKGEKEFIRKAIDAKKVVLGICLGSQLMANALGSAVRRNKESEIGWFPVTLTEAGKKSQVLRRLPQDPTFFCWHDDTFDLPEGATLLASTEVCPNHAFVYGDNAYAFQFHPEMTWHMAQTLVATYPYEVQNRAYIQPSEALFDEEKFTQQTSYLRTILEKLEEIAILSKWN